MSRGQAEWTRLTVRDAQGRRVSADVSERMRVELAERAVSDPTERNLLALALYLRARREHLALFCAGCAGRGYHGKGLLWSPAIWLSLAWLIFAAASTTLKGQSGAVELHVIAFSVLVILTWLTLWLGVPTESRLCRPLLTLSMARQCPYCGYFLRKLNEIDPAATRYIEVGPRCCPECAMLWPLVPPPTHEEVVATALKPSSTT